MSASKIEWTERSDWNPLRGCTRMSEGCRHCYAEAIAARFSDEGQAFHGFAERTSKGPRWTGKVEVMWDRLLLPLSWRKPALIFGSSTSDVFHEALDWQDSAAVYAVAVAAFHLRGHRTQFLTKRADRMRELLTREDWWECVNSHASSLVMERVDPLDRRSDDARSTLDDYGPASPPPGVWLGVSVEDQPTANARIPHLLGTPARVRFVSCEPLLSAVSLVELKHPAGDGRTIDSLRGHHWSPPLGDERICVPAGDSGWSPETGLHRLNWVIVGGESGPGARPMHPDWARGLRDQCRKACVPFLFKQWGEHAPTRIEGTSIEVLGASSMSRYGKAAAGRLLDGVQHDGMPA